MPVLFDSSIYIDALRAGGEASVVVQRWARESRLWLSAVVLEELHAGASRKDAPILAKLERNFERAHRVLVPSQNGEQGGEFLIVFEDLLPRLTGQIDAPHKAAGPAISSRDFLAGSAFGTAPRRPRRFLERAPPRQRRLPPVPSGLTPAGRGNSKA